MGYGDIWHRLIAAWLHVGHIICAHVIFQQTHCESNYIGQLGFKPSHMLANRADLDVYVWVQVGKGLAKLKTAQIIAIISHLENMSTQLPVHKCARKWGCFQNLPVYQKSVLNTLKVHIYLYHWAAQDYIIYIYIYYVIYIYINILHQKCVMYP